MKTGRPVVLMMGVRCARRGGKKAWKVLQEEANRRVKFRRGGCGHRGCSSRRARTRAGVVENVGVGAGKQHSVGDKIEFLDEIDPLNRIRYVCQ